MSALHLPVVLKKIGSAGERLQVIAYPTDRGDVQQPWEKDVENLRERLLEDLRSWRALILPLSAFANFLFFVSLDKLGGGSMSTVLSLMAATGLTLWTVVLQANIEAISAEQPRSDER